MFFWGKLVFSRQGGRGSVLFVVIGALIVLGALGTAVSKLQGSGSSTEVQGNRLDAAYYAALSGINYATKTIDLENLKTAGSGWGVSNLDGAYNLGDLRQFILTTSFVSGNKYKIVSQGVSSVPGVAKQSNYVMSVEKDYTPIMPEPNLGDFNFVNPSNRPDYAMYADVQTRDIPESLDTADIKPKNITVGKDYRYGFGNVWFAGTNTGYSKKGVSVFGDGFRIFFTFKFATNVGDGFVVSVLNPEQNSYLSSGGDSAEGGLLGYAGDSRVYDPVTGGFTSTISEYVDKSGFPKGLNPPKFGVEIDTYSNKGGTWNTSDTTPSCQNDNGLMNDSSFDGISDHVAIVYWGTNGPYYRKTCYGPGSSFEGNIKRYSDVRHGSGSNADDASWWKLQYMDFQAGRTYFFRMDVVKSGSSITVKSWVGTCSGDDLNSSCRKQVYASKGFSDTQRDFSGSYTKLNRLDYVYVEDTHTYTASEEKAFSNFMWGFTSGSGVATQQIDFRNISLSFR
jgi:hypothetical protein